MTTNYDSHRVHGETSKARNLFLDLKLKRRRHSESTNSITGEGFEPAVSPGFTAESPARHPAVNGELASLPSGDASQPYGAQGIQSRSSHSVPSAPLLCQASETQVSLVKTFNGVSHHVLLTQNSVSDTADQGDEKYCVSAGSLHHSSPQWPLYKWPHHHQAVDVSQAQCNPHHRIGLSQPNPPHHVWSGFPNPPHHVGPIPPNPPHHVGPVPPNPPHRMGPSQPNQSQYISPSQPNPPSHSSPSQLNPLQYAIGPNLPNLTHHVGPSQAKHRVCPSQRNLAQSVSLESPPLCVSYQPGHSRQFVCTSSPNLGNSQVPGNGRNALKRPLEYTEESHSSGSMYPSTAMRVPMHTNNRDTLYVQSSIPRSAGIVHSKNGRCQYRAHNQPQLVGAKSGDTNIGKKVNLEELEAKKRFDAFTQQLLQNVGRESQCQDQEQDCSRTNESVTSCHLLTDMSKVNVVPLVAKLGESGSEVTFPVLDWQQMPAKMGLPLPAFNSKHAMPGFMGPPLNLTHFQSMYKGFGGKMEATALRTPPAEHVIPSMPSTPIVMAGKQKQFMKYTIDSVHQTFLTTHQMESNSFAAGVPVGDDVTRPNGIVDLRDVENTNSCTVLNGQKLLTDTKVVELPNGYGLSAMDGKCNLPNGVGIFPKMDVMAKSLTPVNGLPVQGQPVLQCGQPSSRSIAEVTLVAANSSPTPIHQVLSPAAVKGEPLRNASHSPFPLDVDRVETGSRKICEEDSQFVQGPRNAGLPGDMPSNRVATSQPHQPQSDGPWVDSFPSSLIQPPSVRGNISEHSSDSTPEDNRSYLGSTSISPGYLSYPSSRLNLYSKVALSNRRSNTACFPTIRTLEDPSGMRLSDAPSNLMVQPDLEEDQEDRDEVCKICEDRATGLHYGILTCEGCKGFFKRTVQNKRVYRCVGDGNCPVTRMQRNRCQFCRFRKCMEKGMIIAAVREDRMPGGRNSGSLYTSSKVRYRKRHSRSVRSNSDRNRQTALSMADVPAFALNVSPESKICIEKWLWQVDQSSETSSVCSAESSQSSNMSGSSTETTDEGTTTGEHVQKLIEMLLKCESDMKMTSMTVAVNRNCNMSQMLCQLGDHIVTLLVNWMRKLPFVKEIALATYTDILTSKWQDLVLLTMVFHMAGLQGDEQRDKDIWQQQHLKTLQVFLAEAFDQSLTMEEVQEQAGEVIAKVTEITAAFQELGLKQEEYVCLKVLHLFTQGVGPLTPSVSRVQELCLEVLATCTEQQYPEQTERLSKLLILLPQVTTAATMLLKQKLVYILFLFNGSLLFGAPPNRQSEIIVG